MGTITRPARPEDKIKVANLVYLASSSHLGVNLFDYIFDSTKEETISYFEKLFISKIPSWHHWSHCFVAEVDGEVAATTTGYSESVAGTDLFIKAIKELVKDWPIQKLAILKDRAEPLNKIKPPAPRDVWVIENVATFPEYRHHGLMKMLFDEVLEKGREKRFKKAQITFVIGNTEAEKAYEKMGFRFAYEKKDDAFEKAFGTPGLRTFTLEL